MTVYLVYNSSTNKGHMTTDDVVNRDDNCTTGYAWLVIPESLEEYPAGELEVSNGAVVKNTSAIDERLAIEVRQERNKLLIDTDFHALSDSPAMSSEMQTYRQSLRDLPSQSGFPSSVTWPTKP